MKLRAVVWLAVIAALAPTTGVIADDISGADVILCSSAQTSVCTADGDCASGPPWYWNIPQFIEIDIKGKKLATTEASGENRSTPVRHLERTAGLMLVQGAEAGRAFSFVIEEDTGVMSVAVARDGVTVSVFGACTPK